jgi:hypothetical protein
MIDTKILKEVIGTTILEVRTKAFLLDFKIRCSNIVTYFKFSSDQWISLVISEGIIDIAKIGQEPFLSVGHPVSDFEYRVQNYDWRITDSIEKVSLVVSRDNENHYFGLLFNFKDGQSISFLDDDDCILVGPIEPWLENCSIKEITDY